MVFSSKVLRLWYEIQDDNLTKLIDNEITNDLKNTTNDNKEIKQMSHFLYNFVIIVAIYFHLSKYVHVYIEPTTPTHIYSNYNIWSVQFTLTIITYVLLFLWNQQNIIYTI